MRTRFKPALAHRMNAVPRIQPPRNANFIWGGGNALFAPTKLPSQSWTTPKPKPGIQTAGNTNFVQNVPADDRVLCCMTSPSELDAIRVGDGVVLSQHRWAATAVR